MAHSIVHLIGHLDCGGAETVLCRLLEQAGDRRQGMQVATLRGGGELEERIRDMGIPLSRFNFRPGTFPLEFARLTNWLRRQQPGALVSWMYHANLIGGLAARLAGGIPAIWNVRHAALLSATSKRSTQLVMRSGAWCSSRLAQRIVYVATAGREWHEARGYASDRSMVIGNGFDLKKFRPDSDARNAIRLRLCRSTEQPLVGLVGRFHPDKDHRTFIGAAALLRKQVPGVEFVLCGAGIDESNRGLCEWIHRAGLKGAVHLLGLRRDVEQIHAALDVLVSSSVTEAFPNAVGEAMACGVPCVVTDVGDSAAIIADTGKTVRTQDPQAIAKACADLLDEPLDQRRERSIRVRRRIEQEFDLRALANRHFELWENHCSLTKTSLYRRQAA